MSATSIVQQLLTARGIPENEWGHFLHPDFARDLHDPFLLNGMQQVVERLERARSTSEKVVIFGDYDADGIPGTAVMVRGLSQLGFTIEALIPTRAAGYGLNMDAVERIIAMQPGLLITVDNGTVSKDEVAALAAAGIDVVVVDHHEPQEGHMADAALAIINPKLHNSTYPFAELCGCALAWKVLWALYGYLKENQEQLKWLLDLVALSTVADMMPLVGENRALVHFGLKVMAKTKNHGLLALAECSGTDLTKIKAGDIGYRLAPRLNAPSRMHEEEIEGQNASLQLLITDSRLEANFLAEHLHQRNAERQHLLDQQLTEAHVQAAGRDEDLILVVYGAEWSSGIIGLIAGRLMEAYKRPVIVLADEGGTTKGSLRSLDGVDVGEMLQAIAPLLARFGGHAKAGGLTMIEAGVEAVDILRQQVNKWAKGLDLSPADLAQAAEVQPDLEIKLEEVTLNLAEELAVLEPFGIGFRTPLFETLCQVSVGRPVGAGGKHLACHLVDGEERRKAIGFGFGNEVIDPAAKYRVRYTVDIEEWQGRISVGCTIKSLQKL